VLGGALLGGSAGSGFAIGRPVPGHRHLSRAQGYRESCQPCSALRSPPQQCGRLPQRRWRVPAAAAISLVATAIARRRMARRAFPVILADGQEMIQ
ncbi:unnamed protein product, partial [Polarella glacialis]